VVTVARPEHQLLPLWASQALDEVTCPLVARDAVLLNPRHEIGATLGAACERQHHEGRRYRCTEDPNRSGSPRPRRSHWEKVEV